jgi:peptidoglycan/xylan/chitin deacetylase (PgdA/CDA1 family)
MRALIDSIRTRTLPLDVFIRDDDAGWAQDDLDRLLTLFAAQTIPIDLAVIPAAIDHACATRLLQWRRDHPGIGLHQHGYAHLNHEPPDCRKSEFGAARPLQRQGADIVAGRDRLAGLLGSTDPIFTPPWNRCDAATARAIESLGFALYSDDGAARAAGTTVATLAITLDWERARREACLEARLAQHIDVSTQPLGIMLHHAKMDGGARLELANILELLRDNHAIRFHPMRHWMEISR